MNCSLSDDLKQAQKSVKDGTEPNNTILKSYSNITVILQ